MLRTAPLPRACVNSEWTQWRTCKQLPNNQAMRKQQLTGEIQVNRSRPMKKSKLKRKNQTERCSGDGLWRRAGPHRSKRGILLTAALRHFRFTFQRLRPLLLYSLWPRPRQERRNDGDAQELKNDQNSGTSRGPKETPKERNLRGSTMEEIK